MVQMRMRRPKSALRTLMMARMCTDGQNHVRLLVGPIAQLAEQWTFNPWVAGSSPAGPTNKTPDQHPILSS